MRAPDRLFPSAVPLESAEAGLFQGIVEHLGGVVLVCDALGRVRWANSRAGEWLGATGRDGLPGVAAEPRVATLPSVAELSLPWAIDATQLASVSAGATLRLRADTLVGADGVARRCRARLSPLPRTAAPPLVLVWIDEHIEDDEPSLSDSQRRRALSAAQVGSWSRHFADGTARVDPLWCYSLGLDPCEGPDHLERWSRRIHPDDVGRFRRAGAQLASAAPDAPDFDVEYRILSADSRWLWVLQRGRVCRRDPRSDAPLEAAGICIDIDARKRAEVEVHENESRLATALWGAQAAFWQLHIPSDTATRSPLWFAMTGYTQESWNSLPSPWSARLHPEDRVAVERLITEHFAGRSQSLELRYRTRCADGSWKWMMDRGRVVEWDFDGKPIAALGVSMDIDAQKRAELALQSSESRLELALESAQGCLWEWDIAEARYNDAYYELHGVSPAEGRRQRTFWSDRAHPEDRERVLAAEHDLVEGRIESFNTQYRVRHADGSWRWMVDRFRAAERDEQGRATRLIGFAMDVTDDVQVREALQATESALRAATESTPDWLALLDERLHIRFINRGFRGMSAADLLGRDAIPLVDPDWRALTRQNYRHVLETGEPRSFDVLQPIEGAEARRLLHRVVPVPGKGGAIDGVSVVVTDVTAQHAAERRLRESERALRTVTANSNDWMLLLDLDHRVRFVNRPVLGHDIDRMIGQDVFAMVPPGHGEEMRAAIAAVIATGEPRAMLQRLETETGGERRSLEVWVTAARDGEEIVGSVLTITDVSERMRQQQALQAQAQILQTMSEPVLLVDRDGIAKMVNPAFEALACRAASELVGQPVFELLRRCVAEYDEITGSAEAHWRAHPRHVPARREFDWRRPDGQAHRLLAAFSHLQIDGAPHVLCVYTDLTEQREVERQILDVVQRAQRRIGADLHDGLGQELTGVAMLLRGLHRAVGDGRAATPGQIEEVIGHVNRSIETARAMARGLAPVDPEHGGLGGALQRLAASSSRQSGVDVELRYEVPPTLVFSQEESTHLLRIAQEGVSNALRHGQPRTVQISLAYESGHALLCVRDDGRGFPDATEPQRGLGLKTMRFRASVLRGDLQILRNEMHALHGSGITLICRVPVHSRRLVGTTVV